MRVGCGWQVREVISVSVSCHFPRAGTHWPFQPPSNASNFPRALSTCFLTLDYTETRLLGQAVSTRHGAWHWGAHIGLPYRLVSHLTMISFDVGGSGAYSWWDISLPHFPSPQLMVSVGMFPKWTHRLGEHDMTSVFLFFLWLLKWNRDHRRIMRKCRMWGSQSCAYKEFWVITPWVRCRLLSRRFLARPILRSWRWRRQVPSKRLLTFNGLHDVISQKMVEQTSRTKTGRVSESSTCKKFPFLSSSQILKRPEWYFCEKPQSRRLKLNEMRYLQFR
jgi:hypothetical protein